MLLSDFPQEILQKITDTLCLQDKKSCCLVSKSWKNIFQDSLYSDLIITYQKTLDDILNISQDNQPNYQENGHLVRYIRLHQVDTTEKDVYALQKTFPNINYIYFSPSYIDRDNLRFDTDWSHWNLLQELYLVFRSVHIPDLGDRIVKVIMCLPLLRRLEINCESPVFSQILFSLNHLETIHSNLKHLGHLRLNPILLSFSETDLGRLSQLLPATTVRSLNVSFKNMDYRLLCYFARKYPNLRTLEFSASSFQPDIEDQRHNTADLLCKIHLPFQRLEKLTIQHDDCIVEKDILLWGITNFDNIPLKHISIGITLDDDRYPDNLCDVSKRIVETCLTKFSETIESFYLDSPSTDDSPINLIDMKTSLCNLVKLHIRSSVSVELDTFLSLAPRLESLALYDADIKIKDELYTSKRFGLQSLILYSGKITSDVLRFLSFHCRGLKELDLTKLSVYGNFTTPGCQFIDMTYSRLDTLYIESTVFIIKDNTECPDNVNIMLITRPVEDIPQKQEYDPNVLPTVIETPTKAHYDWFYVSGPKTIHPILKAQSSRIMKFFSNYEENKRITLEEAHMKKEASDHWKERCVFGYTHIELGYVDDYEVDRTWPKRH